MKRLLVIGCGVSIAAPAFAFGIWSEPAVSPASMVWLGLAGLAVAGSPRRRDDGSSARSDS